jgi:glycosyltransferase involved in cell wall biosynthesis
MKSSFYKSHCPNAVFLMHLSRDEVLNQMRASDVFLFPTYAEGRALVVLEALSSCLPVITTNNAGFDDININNNFGYIVEPGDCTAISNILSEMRNNPAIINTLKSNISKHLDTVCSWDDFSREYLNLIYGVAS